jgi:NADH:ubiquinone oxidoreductase subunit F (NADH-binding)
MTATLRERGIGMVAGPEGPSRLLDGYGSGGADFAGHRARLGPLPAYAPDRLIAAVTDAGLRGRGGAGFPTGRKLAAVAARGRAGGLRGRRPIVVVNACEGEPASAKDHTMLAVAAHLVLDGAALAAGAVGADEAVVCVHRGAADGVRRALAQRHGDPVRLSVAEVPRRYVASEESALVHFLTAGDARPTATPPRPFERGVDGRPTLVDNAETLAHLARIAYHGPAWFRRYGTSTDPGTSLITVSGAVRVPAVYEMPLGSTLGEVLGWAGGGTEPLAAVLVGGYFGTWVAVPQALGMPLSHDPAGQIGATLGAGALVALPASACGWAETARVLRYLAQESAGQCGPCRFGLPAVAADVAAVAAGRAGADTYRRLRTRLGVIAGRGACRHPDGAIRFAASALAAFPADLDAHLAGRPCAGSGRTLLPLPTADQRDGGWR